VFKRLIDIMLSALLLIVALPVLTVAAVAIRIESEGPALFRQDRMGRGFRRFKLLKLRTMNLAGDGPAYTLGADPRITRCGRWLRKLKIDELPQLWNVLRGDMSLVGPRPVIPELAMEFMIAYTKLLEVRPGLTDPASLKYCRETEILALAPDPMRYFKTVVTPDKLRISQAYLQTSNSWTDLLIIARTGLAIILPIRGKLSMPVFARQERQLPLHHFQASAASRRTYIHAEGADSQSRGEQLIQIPDFAAISGRIAGKHLAYRHFRRQRAGADFVRQRFWLQ
jgi:lipopolysaccharide/colanic/teichoic acid biosynthesis glycosyltransferase